MARRKVRPPRDWHDGDFNSHIKGDGDDKKTDDKKTDDKESGPIGGPAKDHH